MLFKPGERVRYHGDDNERFGLKTGMEGEVIRCFPDSVDVYYDDLQRVVHLKDFHMRTTLKRTPAIATAKRESRSPRIKIIGLIAGIALIAAMVMVLIKYYR